MPPPLTDTERAILAREHKSAFTSERLPPIFDEFGILPDVYFARLSKLIDREDVLAEFPVLVRHLRRVRRGRKRSRGLGG